MVRRESPDDLPQLERRLLGKVLEAFLSTGVNPPALKVRADNYPHVKAMDDLERRGFLRRVDMGYVVAVTTLPLLGTEAADLLVQRMERIYAVLRRQYAETQDRPLTVAQVAQDVHLSLGEVAQLLQLMSEVSFWNRGGTTDLLQDGAYVVPSEDLLKYPTYSAMLGQVREWSRQPAGGVVFNGGFPEWGPSQESVAADPPEQPPSARPAGASPVEGSILLAWPAVRACVQEFSFNDIKEVAGLAGLDLTQVAHLVQKPQDGATKGQLLSAVDGQFGKMGLARQQRFLTILAEELLRRQPAAEEKLAEYLSRLGWSFVGRTLVPLEILDTSALEWTPQECRKDLLKAAQRLRDGDLSGAISAACGAVDSATSNVYAQFALGDPTHASFQERCKRAALARGVLPELEQRLQELGWLQEDVRPFRKNLEGALNQGAYVLQTLRSHMGDVHGSKPILASLVFDCLHWSELLVASLTSQGPDERP